MEPFPEHYKTLPHHIWKRHKVTSQRRAIAQAFKPVPLKPSMPTPEVFSAIAKPCRWPNSGSLGDKLNKQLWQLVRVAITFSSEALKRPLMVCVDQYKDHIDVLNTMVADCFVPGKKVISDWKEIPRIKSELHGLKDKLNEDTVSIYLYSLLYFGDQQRQMILRRIGMGEIQSSGALLTNFPGGKIPLVKMYPEFCKGESVGRFGEVATNIPSFFEDVYFSLPICPVSDPSHDRVAEMYKMWVAVEVSKPLLRWVCATEPTDDELELFLPEVTYVFAFFDQGMNIEYLLHDFIEKHSELRENLEGGDWFESFREFERKIATHSWLKNRSTLGIMMRLYGTGLKNMTEIIKCLRRRVVALEARYFDYQTSITFSPPAAMATVKAQGKR